MIVKQTAVLKHDHPQDIDSTLSWPTDDAELRLPWGPVSEAFLRAIIGGGSDPSAGSAVSPPQVEYAPGRARASIAGNLASGWVERVSPLTLDVALVVLDLLQRNGGAASVNARMVLERKGYRRWGCERRAFEQKILGELKILSRFCLHAATGSEPLFVLAPRNVARTDFMARAAAPLAGELANESYRGVASAVLRLDHRRNRGADSLAKKLAVLVALADASSSFYVGELLMRAGELPTDGSQLGDDRLAERFNAASQRLAAVGLDLRSTDPVDCRNRAGLGWLASEVEVHQRTPPKAFSKPSVTGGPVALEVSNDPQDGDAKGVGLRRGRPRFEPSLEQRRLVVRLHAAGTTREAIARAIGVSLPTLRAYFAVELFGGDIVDTCAEQRSAVIFITPKCFRTRNTDTETET